MNREKLKEIGFSFNHAERTWEFKSVTIKDSVIEHIPEELIDDTLLTTLDDALSAVKLKMRMKRIAPQLNLPPMKREPIRVAFQGEIKYTGGCPGCEGNHK